LSSEFANSFGVLSRARSRLPGAGNPLWVRLHALTGAIPLAGYLALHLGSQAFAFGGGRSYSVAQGWIERLPGLAYLEVALLYLPLSFHVAAGLWRARLPALPTEQGWARRWGRPLQQLSGGVLLAFLAYHFWQFRWRLWMGELDATDVFPELCASLSSTVWGGVPLLALSYILGLAAAAFHLAQGLHHVWAGWGFGPPGRQRLAAPCCAAAGLSMFILGTLIVIDLATGSVVIHWPG
jgi:succinate dehydrogenase / fumarate reductase cytochrome b subunit